MEAYRLYTMGRWKLDQRTEDGMHKSLEFFNQAVAQDPDYALAWVGIADALTLLFDYGHESADNTLQKAGARCSPGFLFPFHKPDSALDMQDGALLRYNCQ